MTEVNEKNGNDKLVCLECGEEVGFDHDTCPSCGSERHLIQSESGVTELPTDTPSPVRTRPAVFSTIAILIVTGFSLILINALRTPALENEDPVDEKISESQSEPDAVDEEILASAGNQEVEDDVGDLIEAAEYHRLQGELPEAIMSFEKALAINNDDVAIIEELTKAYIKVDDVDSAMFHLERWMALNSDDPLPHTLKGSILYGRGEFAGARDEFQTAVNLAGDNEELSGEYSAKVAQIDEYLAERERLTEEAEKYDIGEGWIHEELPGYKPPVREEAEEVPLTGNTPLSQIIQQVDEEESEDGSVLIGEGAEEDSGEVEDETTDTAEEETSEDVTETPEEEDVEDEPEGRIRIEVGEETAEPQHVFLTGARYEASDDVFSIYLDTSGRAQPKHYYDEPSGVLWLTIPNAECDFTKVPLERTFTKTFVSSIKTWNDDEGNVRFKIKLKAPVHITSPTIMALGISMHLRRVETVEEGE